jgi:hypothetical protein
MTWWDALEEYLTEREMAAVDEPDPWADVELGAGSLTDEQIAYLGFDQPGIPRLGGLTPDHAEDGTDGDDTDPTGHGTGNSPGDD